MTFADWFIITVTVLSILLGGLISFWALKDDRETEVIWYVALIALGMVTGGVTGAGLAIFIVMAPLLFASFVVVYFLVMEIKKIRKNQTRKMADDIARRVVLDLKRQRVIR
jgi:uncharacterized membrane protein YoaK (UPF0700 family)